MTKTDLQKELLEKVKPGTKPSDLKKQNDNQRSNKKQKDEGYESDSSNKSIPKAPSRTYQSPKVFSKENTPLPNQQIKELQKQVNYWSQTASNHLKNLQLAQAKISNLEEQLRKKPKNITPLTIVPVKSESELLEEKNKQIEIIAKENEVNSKSNEKNIEKVKELEEALKAVYQTYPDIMEEEKPHNVKKYIGELEAKISDQEKTIKELKKQVKTTTNTKQKPTLEPKESLNKKSPRSFSNPVENKPPKLYLFTCDICDQHKKSQLHLAKVNGLGIDPNKQNKICDYCINKVDVIKERGEFF